LLLQKGWVAEQIQDTLKAHRTIIEPPPGYVVNYTDYTDVELTEINILILTAMGLLPEFAMPLTRRVEKVKLL